jgi:hypothetical protein
VPSHGMHLRATALTGLTAVYAALVDLGVIDTEQMEVTDALPSSKQRSLSRSALPDPERRSGPASTR